ncbi:hypothetical protein EJ08DRAFT_664326 [Tothia fuscella]|uniref:Uncharacterized protein n=1 Tax=Tothia fuscella TaxID=1048955 RepID=A0A9P4NJ93_9PEZI|nr:hypothetical protein EJ08DRAFT_664326 [Tothia fuscella]
MHFTKATLMGLVPVTLAANIPVMVGPGGGLTFSPNTVNADVGDVIVYSFATQNHTVTAGTPGQGCKPSGQFNSGFVPAPGAAAAAGGNGGGKGKKAKKAKKAKKGGNQARGDNNIFLPRQNNLPTFSVPVTSTDPITVYCAQAQHCQAGMVMVINPTQDGATSLAAYQKVSAKAKTNTVADGVNGGTLANVQGQNAGKGAKKAKKAKGGAKKAKKAKAGKAGKRAKGN